MYSREQRKTSIDVKCPKCGKVRGVKVDTIVHWARRSNKKFEDYEVAKWYQELIRIDRIEK